jgi:multidrug efflux pump subunit AcrB/ABC-type multidrug transport system ATPase subunit
MKFLTLSIRRPMAVSMFFLAIALVGSVAWQRMSVELFPQISGDQLFVSFSRPGSEPEVIEREILMPLHARVSAMPLVAESWGQIQGSFGTYQVQFEPGAELKVRELELQRAASAIQREQPRDTQINVQSSDTSAFSSFVMMLHVLGGDTEDQNSLHDIVAELVAPRFAAVSGVSQVRIGGGARRQVTVVLDPARVTAMGMTTESVTEAVNRNVGQLQFLGELENEDGRTSVMLDGRPSSLEELGRAQVDRTRPVKLEHLGNVEFGAAREDLLFRVNGKPSVGLIIYQEEGTNLVRLGRELRERVADVGNELAPLGLSLVIGQDGAELVEDQISRLGNLGLSGFIVALVVLYLFLRQWRAVAVIGVAVPVSLFAALSFLYLLGQSLNLITLFGLALAIGLVVDNSVVVYEAVLRQLERGASPENAIRDGLRRTVRAIAAASATTAVVFLPLMLVDFDDVMMREIAKVITMAIILPLAASLLVAVGLVPLLTHRLAAPAAVRNFERSRENRTTRGHLLPPDRARLFFTGVVKSALRNPPTWITGTIIAVILTAIIAIPWIGVNSSEQQAEEADSVSLSTRFYGGRVNLDKASSLMAKLEQAAMDIEGVKTVEAMIQEEGGSLTIQLEDRGERPRGVPNKVYFSLRKLAKEVEVLRPGEDEMGGGRGSRGGEQMFSGAPLEVMLSGPDSAQLQRLAENVRTQLDSMPQVAQTWMSVRDGMEELWVEPNHRAFESFGLTFDDVLPALNLAGREGERIWNNFVLPSGRELPVLVERINGRNQQGARGGLAAMRVYTDSGVVPVMALASMRKMPPPPVIAHHNGRRELSVYYRLDQSVPETGPGRIAIEEQIIGVLRTIPRPRGFAIANVDTDDSADILQQALVPVVLLLFLVLAMTFESLVMPTIVLLALPLTLLGATWALVIAGMPLDMMAMLGALALIGLTVNPAILLVDRMQQRVRGGWSSGAAALASVRERTRPVLMTTATTIAGLWPLALVTGRENEIWPPFATIVMGGLVTSTLLTLLMIPVGFILLRRLDNIFGRVGPWLVLVWLGSVVAVMSALIFSDTIVSMFWQVSLTFMIGGALLAIVVLAFRPKDIPEPHADNGPPRMEVRYLHKIYGLPGPLRRTLLASKQFAQQVLERGGVAFQPLDAQRRLMPIGLFVMALGYLTWNIEFPIRKLVFLLITASVMGFFLVEVRRARGLANNMGVVTPGGPENWLAVLLPWIALVAVGPMYTLSYLDVSGGDSIAGAIIVPGIFALFLGIFQATRRSARRQASGELSARAMNGSMRGTRNVWRSFALRVGGLNIPTTPIAALSNVSFTVERGMVGILGPNGAGKSTLLRQLAGVVDPTRGNIYLGGVPMAKIQRYLARWVGYLPQDAGMPGGMSGREYLSYFAALYDLAPEDRAERVTTLLDEVGLSAKADDPIKSLSGGMRQRVAVARTLLRLPPIIIVDEPTVGLDPRERIRFRNLLSRLAQDRIVLFSTHVVEDVAVACDRVLVFARGRLVFDGDPVGLSNFAENRVWQIRTPAGERPVWPQGAIPAEETPTEDGGVMHRVLSASQPDPDAASIPATLEDGYMWLLNNAVQLGRDAK